MTPRDRYTCEWVECLHAGLGLGLAPSAESWHRDEAELALPDDLLFGGWWTFDDEDQFFSCVPGSHVAVSGNKGFALVKDKEQIKAYKQASAKVRIPPGSIIVFYERILHEVLAKKAPRTMLRQFLGWRLTKSDEPLYPIDAKFKMQAVMPLKSNQTPPMFAKLHWTNWRDKIEDFTQKYIVDECQETRRVESGLRKGDSHRIVHQNMRSLEEYGLPLYAKYAKREVDMHRPRTKFVLLDGASDKKRKIRF